MSENTINKFAILNVDFPESIDNAAKNLTDLPTKKAGQTLADCWFLVFGGISQAAEKKKIKYAHNLELFKKSLEEKISKIPDNNRVEAKTQVVMPALENSKYCVEEETIREMFANLISSSIDNRKNELVHPSFSEFLKTMTPLDAQNLLLLRENIYLPICDVTINKTIESKSYFNYLIQNLFLFNYECDDIEKISLSITYLTRLGLVEIPYGEFVNDEFAYDIYEDSKYLENFKLEYPNYEIKLEKRLLRLTPLGSSFLDVSCSEKIVVI